MTAAPMTETVRPEAPMPTGGGPRVVLRSLVSVRWLPALAAVAMCAVFLLNFGVSAPHVAKYAGWLLYGIVLPGTLVWRSLRGTPRSFVEDVAAGAAVGYALEILVYIVLRAVDAPMLILAWPAVVIVAFAAVPRLRPHWRSGDAPRVPAAWSWFLSGSMIVAAGWFAIAFFRIHPLSGPTAAYPYVDLPYHLALAAEVKHHVLPTWPYVLGADLRHHWFPAVDVAATSWATGIELREVLLRLPTYPFIAITMVLTAVLAVRLSGRWWPGPVAVFVTFFVAVLSPYSWSGGSIAFESRLLSMYAWASPTQMAAFALFAPVAILLVDRLRREPGAAGQWALIALLLAAVMGSKATYLPLILSGLAVVGGVQLLLRRRIDRPVLIAVGIAMVFFLFGTFALYGGGSYGMAIDPLSSFRTLGYLQLTGLTLPGSTDVTWTVALAVTVLGLIGTFTRTVGVLGLTADPERRRDPAVLFLAGTALAGVAVLLLFGHPGSSQAYFLHSVYPLLGALSAYGFATLVPVGRRIGPVLAALAAAAVFGGLVTREVMKLDGTVAPMVTRLGSRRLVLLELYKPLLAIVAVLVLAAVAVYLLRRRVSWLRGVSLALVFAAVTGTGLAGTYREGEWWNRVAHDDRLWSSPLSIDGRPIPDEALTAGRWLRDHSSVDDVVATNSHCRVIFKGQCDNRHFWIAAYTERRIVVEGWGYTDYALTSGKGGKQNFRYVAFQDAERLAENDRVFQQPSRANLDLLKRKYQVRWLFVDERYDRPADGLAELATERYRSDHFTIYEVTR